MIATFLLKYIIYNTYTHTHTHTHRVILQFIAFSCIAHISTRTLACFLHGRFQLQKSASPFKKHLRKKFLRNFPISSLLTFQEPAKKKVSSYDHTINESYRQRRQVIESDCIESIRGQDHKTKPAYIDSISLISERKVSAPSVEKL